MVQPLAPLGSSPLGPKAPDREQTERLDAAHQFESLLVQQLLKAMRSTVKGGGLSGSEGASGQYLAMFDQVIADSVSQGGGIGLSGVLMQAMGGEEAALPSQALPSAQRTLSSTSMGAAPLPPLPGLAGATLRLAKAAYGMSAADGGRQWSRDGVLSTRDLASPGLLQADGTHSPFSVDEAAGYRDAYKCNLFALEAARRAGFEVPLVQRARGVGFPTSTTIAEDASDGVMRGNWARPVEPSEVPELIEKVKRGEAAVLLSASGTEGRLGHMAVVERIHSVKLDAEGNIRHIEFDGFEARKDGAQHLQKRSWNLYGHGEDTPLARNGFGRIQALVLKPQAPVQIPETAATLDNRPPQANLLSSSANKRPIP